MLGKITKILSLVLNLIFGTWAVFATPGKLGYGTVSEAMAYKLPFIFISRDYFNEEPYLREMLEVQLDACHICYSFSFHCISSISCEVTSICFVYIVLPRWCGDDKKRYAQWMLDTLP